MEKNDKEDQHEKRDQEYVKDALHFEQSFEECDDADALYLMELYDVDRFKTTYQAHMRRRGKKKEE